MIFDNGK
jgi:hypothetical protein